MKIKDLIFGEAKKSYVCLSIIVYSICIALAFDEKNRNILLVVYMVFSCATLIFYNYITRIDFYIFAFIFTIAFFPLLAHDVPPRWSTIVYTSLFSLSFVAFYKNYIVSNFTVEDFIIILKFTISLYGGFLIFQQVSVVLGIEPMNLRNYNLAEPFKLNSLGAEPSWSGRIIALLFYCFLTARETSLGRAYGSLSDFSKDKLTWFFFLWSMITMISGTAVVFLAIVLIKFLRLKSIVFLGLFLLLSITVLEYHEVRTYERARDVAFATLTLDESKIIAADGSGAYRIVPLITLAKSVDITSFNGLFGHGVDSVSRDLDFNLPGSHSDASPSTLLSVWYEYGFFAFFIFVLLSLRLTVNSFQSLVFWFMLIFLYNLNVQIPWLAIMLLHINKNLSLNK